MQPIPQPHLLDPDRVLDNDRNHLTPDHETRARLLDEALHDTCAYARQLWDNLDTTRAYLLSSLPPDPRSPEPHNSFGASPTGPDDTDGWNNWSAIYAQVTSALCGPHGDSGYGLSEARREAQLRRSAPTLQILAEHPGLSRHQPTPPAPMTDEESQPGKPPRHPARLAAQAALIFLALRGLRPRGRSDQEKGES